jgi:alpha-ketoglutarate-dependent taurine dioxygenase
LTNALPAAIVGRVSPIDSAAVSVVPARTSCLSEATRLLRQDGAVIVCGHPHGAEDIEALLRSVSTDVVNVGEPVEVRAAGGRDRPDLDADGHRERSPLHTDGFALADGAPDLLALACETSVPGGESFVVDMNRVFAQLVAAGEEWLELARFLVEHPVDQTEPGKRPSTGTIGLRAPGGRIVWRCSYHLGPLVDDPDPQRTRWLLGRWTDLLEELADHATRFRIETGETLLADNTVVFHGRDPYEDQSRLLWRVWAWTPRAARPETAPAVSDTSWVGADA